MTMTHPIERASVEQAREILLDACRHWNVEAPPGHMLMAPFVDEATPWLVALTAIQQARDAGFAEGVERAAKVVHALGLKIAATALGTIEELCARCQDNTDAENAIRALSAEANEGRCDES